MALAANPGRRIGPAPDRSRRRRHRLRYRVRRARPHVAPGGSAPVARHPGSRGAAPSRRAASQPRRNPRPGHRQVPRGHRLRARPQRSGQDAGLEKILCLRRRGPPALGDPLHRRRHHPCRARGRRRRQRQLQHDHRPGRHRAALQHHGASRRRALPVPRPGDPARGAGRPAWLPDQDRRRQR